MDFNYILRRDIDEVLSKVSIYRHFFEYLENLGYEVRGDVDSPNLSVIAEGWQRPVRLKRLGSKYTPDAIKERLLRNLDDRNREMPISVTVLFTQAPTKSERRRDFRWRVSANLP